MNQNSFKTRQQIAQELGVSYSTLYRRLKNADLNIKGNILDQETVQAEKALFFDYNRSNLSIDQDHGYGLNDLNL